VALLAPAMTKTAHIAAHTMNRRIAHLHKIRRTRGLPSLRQRQSAPGSNARILVERRLARQSFRFAARPLTIRRFRYRIPCRAIPWKRCRMPAATSFEKLEHEKLNAQISRQMMSGADATLARIFIARGGIVPRHSHRSEQFSLILSGALKFFFDDGEITVVHAGELLLIPAHVPHRAEALEDTVDIDFFAPRREDWINKTDAYLRTGEPQKKD
jgi:quercetin dioxygenase-like cupin family protein